VRLTAEGMSGNAVTEVSMPYTVVTQAALLTAAPISPNGNFKYEDPASDIAVDNPTLFLNAANPAQSHSTVSFTLNKPATLTVYVTGPDLAIPVTLQGSQLMLGGPGHVYNYPWSGNYPLSTSGGQVNLTGTSDPATFNVATVDPDDPTITDTETVPISLSLLENSSAVTGNLNITSPDGTSFSGVTVVRGDARFYYEIQARGQKFDPIPVTITVSATGGQTPVLWYPFVPYSYYIHRHYPKLRLQPWFNDYVQYGSSDSDFLGICTGDGRYYQDISSFDGFMTIKEDDTGNVLDTATGNNTLSLKDGCLGSNRFFYYLHHQISVFPPLSSSENSSSAAWDRIDTGYYETVSNGWGKGPDLNEFLQKSGGLGSDHGNSIYTGPPSNAVSTGPNNGGYMHFSSQTWGSASSYSEPFYPPLNVSQGTVLSFVIKDTEDLLHFDGWKKSLLNNRMGPWFGLANQGADAALTVTGKFNDINRDFTNDFATNSDFAFPSRAVATNWNGQGDLHYLEGSEVDILEPFVPYGQNGVTVYQLSGSTTLLDTT
ncbi:MAG TPA: hypothetical protein VJ873_02135, partial [bacterium]|nr:hypothetical protein [bacterium]